VKIWNELAEDCVQWWTSVPLVVKPMDCIAENEFRHSNEGGWDRKVITAKGTELFSLAS
jgi:hypothetical protein